MEVPSDIICKQISKGGSISTRNLRFYMSVCAHACKISYSICVLFYLDERPEAQNVVLLSMAFHKDGLYAAGDVRQY